MRIGLWRLPTAIVAIGVFCLYIARGAEKPLIHWNQNTSSSILRQDNLSKLDPAVQTWKIRQMAWPTDEDMKNRSVIVDDKLRRSCKVWLDKFMAKGALPEGLEGHLIALKETGLIKEASKQKRLCDVFLVRYQIGSQIIQIQESPFNVVIVYADEQNAPKPRTDRQAYILEVSKSLLRETICPNPGSEDFNVIENTINGKIWTKVIWAIDSVIVKEPDGRKATSLPKVWEIGTSSVEAETNGAFIRFEIIKSPGDKRASYDPYEKRFGE